MKNIFGNSVFTLFLDEFHKSSGNWDLRQTVKKLAVNKSQTRVDEWSGPEILSYALKFNLVIKLKILLQVTHDLNAFTTTNGCVDCNVFFFISRKEYMIFYLMKIDVSMYISKIIRIK